MRDTRGALRDAWALARPFWFSEERWSARGLLAVVVLLNLALVGMNVILTFWNRAFYNSLQDKNWEAFSQLLFLGRHDPDEGYLPGFCVVAALFILVAVFQLYLRQLLQIRWRRWMTGRITGDWLRDRAYYRIALSDTGTDNPDQRISEDVNSFVSQNLSLGLGLMNSVVTLVSFIAVLWNLSDPVNVLELPIPGYLVWVALLYSALGTWPKTEEVWVSAPSGMRPAKKAGAATMKGKITASCPKAEVKKVSRFVTVISMRQFATTAAKRPARLRSSPASPRCRAMPSAFSRTRISE